MIGRPRWSDILDRPDWRWATVEQVAPLRLSFAGELLDSIEPQGATAGLAMEDRVWCQLMPGVNGSAMQVIILLKAGSTA